MAKQQRCLMCGDGMYEMENFGAAKDGKWPATREDPRFGTLLICPHCEAEHVMGVDRTPGAPNVLRVRALKPRD